MPKRTQDWLDQGLELLAEGGVKALTIEALAAEVGLTKGSFYHHFKNMGDYEEKLVDMWAHECLSTTPKLPKKETQLLSALDAFISGAFSQDTNVELAIRSWAQQDEMVRARVAQVDSARYTYVLSSLVAIVADWEKASLMADMLYSILVGSSAVIPGLSDQRVQEIYKEFKRLYKLSEKEPIELQGRLPI